MNKHERFDDLAAYHRRPSAVTTGLIVSGDLPYRRSEAAALLDRWVALGVTTIVDCRGEANDARLVEAQAPHVRYVWVGTHDNGGDQSDEWFDEGVAGIITTMDSGGTAMVHCHMGINRGPSMAFAALIARGWGVTEALDAIRAVRPIAAISYAEDAVRWHARRTGVSETAARALRREVRTWMAANGIDVGTVIRLIRRADAAS